MRICLLTSAHKPDDDRIFYKEARSLAKRYEDVWIISPFSENVPNIKEGVRFIPINYLPTWFERLKNMGKLYKAALNLNADVYHCHEPESLEVALKLKKELGCKVIFDSHEMYSATFAQNFPIPFHNQIIYGYKFFERKRIQNCDYVLGATSAISDYLKKIVGSERTETILNCTLPDIFGESNERRWNGETIICHEGYLSFSRGLKTMIKAIEIVIEKHHVKFRIIGDVFGTEKKWLESYIAKHNLKSVVEITGWLDYRNVGSVIRECHIGLLALEKLPNHIIAAPNKVFNYMYYGLPFLAPNHCLWINKLIKEEKIGISVDSDSAISYANAISYIIDNRSKAAIMGANAKRASENKYRWTHMEKKLFKVYKYLE